MNTWIEIAAALETTINRVMDEAYPFNWNEDYLSRRLLHQIHGCLQTRPYLRGNERVQVSMECYKLVGNQERTFGDIGLLITVARKGTAPLTGAAYLEAKRRKEATTRFPELNTSQAKRILRKAPKAALLLYDYEFSTEFIGPLGFELWNRNDRPAITIPVPARPVVKVRAVPLSTALATQTKDTRLYPYGTPLSIQLVTRYFCGLDLEFSTECVQSLMGRSDRFLPKRLAVINVVEGGGQINTPEINPQVFVREPDESAWPPDPIPEKTRTSFISRAHNAYYVILYMDVPEICLYVAVYRSSPASDPERLSQLWTVLTIRSQRLTRSAWSSRRSQRPTRRTRRRYRRRRVYARNCCRSVTDTPCRKLFQASTT